MATCAEPKVMAHLVSLALDTDPLANLRSEFEVEVASHAYWFSL
jgi:hypothetical protein